MSVRKKPRGISEGDSSFGNLTGRPLEKPLYCKALKKISKLSNIHVTGDK